MSNHLPVTNADLLTEEQAAQFLQIQPRTVRAWRGKGLPHVKLTARVIRFRRADLDGWISKQRVAVVS